MEIRQVKPTEQAAWLTLRQRLWPDHSLEELGQDQLEILGDPAGNCVFVAAGSGGDLVGFVEVSLRDWAEGCSTRPVGYIEGWYILPESRRSGVGRRLVRAAENWARERGCREMASDAELGNQISRLAHLALGYNEAIRLVCFTKKLT